MNDIVLPKIVATGIYNSSVAVKNREVTKNRKTTMFEIELAMENGGVSYIDGKRTPITTDLLICAKPGQIRHTKLPFKCYFVHIMVKEGALYDMLCDIPNFVISKKREVYEGIFKKLCKYYDSGLDEDNVILQSCILELIHTLSREADKLLSREKMKSNNNIVIEKVLKYIENNLTADLKLEKLAEVASLSPVHFHNCFKASTGRTPNDYVEEQRLRKAVNLLLTTDMSLTRIAFECGFSSQSYFSFVFKRRMKTTPRNYAKEVYQKYDL